MPAARADDFAPFAAYCRQRLDDDPHLRAAALLAEVTLLGFPGTRPTFYRALERHKLQLHPCPDCHIARISGYAPLAEASRIKPSPLPLPASPVTGETLASFLNRLAVANRTSTEALPEALPPWFGIKARWHDDRWQHDQLIPREDDAAARLAAISGTTATAIRNALPAFGSLASQPARAGTACRALHRGPAHQPASPCSPARAPPGLPPARHLAIQDRNTAVQRQRMPRHHGRRAPGTPAPPAQHRRTAHPRQDPGRTGTRRPCCPAGMETADARTHHVKLADGRRVMPAGTVRCGRLPRNRRHGRQHDHPVTRHSEQSSLTQANPRAPTTRQIGQWPLRQVSYKIPQPRSEPRTEDDWMTPDSRAGGRCRSLVSCTRPCRGRCPQSGSWRWFPFLFLF